MLDRRAAAFCVISLLGALLVGCATPHVDGKRPGATYCPQPGQWTVAGQAQPKNMAEVMAHIDGARVVLLGERHDLIEDHRWQLHVLAALHSRRPDLAVGFEMFQRHHQDALDAWSAGQLSEEELLRASDWFDTWGFPSHLYSPLLQFTRMHAVPAVALNVDRALVSRIAREGWDAIAADERGEVGLPAPPPAAYRERLAKVFSHHPTGGEDDREARLERFVGAQAFWDRAMAEAIAETLAAGHSQVVGIVGRGHVEYGHGIPHQLADLGVDAVTVLLPYRDGDTCMEASTPVADALFGLARGPSDRAFTPLRLGVAIVPHEQGVEVAQVMPNSVAERAGVQGGDVILRAAGQPVRERMDLLLVLDRHWPQDVLPIELLRDDARTQVMVTFLPAKPPGHP